MVAFWLSLITYNASFLLIYFQGYTLFVGCFTSNFSNIQLYLSIIVLLSFRTLIHMTVRIILHEPSVVDSIIFLVPAALRRRNINPAPDATEAYNERSVYLPWITNHQT